MHKLAYQLKKSLIMNVVGFFLISGIFYSCSEVKPQMVEPGTQCTHCKMGIVDQRFHAELMTDKGRHFHFDSIECLIEFIDLGNTKTKALWVNDFSDKTIILDFEKAIYLVSEKVPSPMGANLSAHRDNSTAESIIKNAGSGKILSPEEVKKYILEDRRKKDR